MPESSAPRHLRPSDGARHAPRVHGAAAAAWAERHGEGGGEARFRALIEHSSEFIAVVDRDTHFLYANPAAQRVLGRLPADLVGIAGLSLAHPDDLAGALDQLAACLRTPGVPVRIDLRWRHEDGSWRTVVGTAVNLLDDPAVGGIVINARDLTERVALEERLRQAEKMDAVGRLAGGVAHDFNNLLMVMGGNAEFLRTRLAEAGLPEVEVAEIEDAIDRATALTRQLLTFSRKQPRSPRLVDLGAEVAHFEGMLRRLIGEDVALVVHLAPEPLGVRVDRTQLEQVVLNLALNARDAVAAAQAAARAAARTATRVPPGTPAAAHGTIEITTARVVLDADRVRRHPGLAAGEYAVLAVRDTGTGMDADTQSRVFEPFFTTKPTGRGTGLGLATVYAAVTQSGGTVEVESATGHGSIFRAYFPFVQGTADDVPRVTRRGAGELPRGSETILVVEDDASVRATVRRQLELLGYTILEATNGRDALRLCATTAERVALVLSDVVMPEMGATELVAHLRDRIPALPVLLMSGYDEADARAPDLDALDVGRIQKPVEAETLAFRVRAALDARGPGAR